MSKDYNDGFSAGQRGSIFGPTSAEGSAGFNAGVAHANAKPSVGSAEWLIAPVVLAPFVAIFYPVATAAALAIALATEAVVNATGLGGNSLLRWALVLLPTAAVFWPVCRMDQQWGLNNRTYYLARHLMRLLVFAAIANGAAQNAAASAANLASMPAMEAMLKTPVQWMPVLLMLVFWQLFFMRAYKFRLYWNERLISWRLRPKDFPPFYFSWGRAPKVHQPQASIPLPPRWGGGERGGDDRTPL